MNIIISESIEVDSYREEAEYFFQHVYHRNFDDVLVTDETMLFHICPLADIGDWETAEEYYKKCDSYIIRRIVDVYGFVITTTALTLVYVLNKIRELNKAKALPH